MAVQAVLAKLERSPSTDYTRETLLARALRALGELGIDPAKVLERTASIERGRHVRASWPTHAFWEAAVAVSGRSGIGVQVAECLRPSDFGLLGNLVSSSSTLGEGLLHGLRLSLLSIASAQLALYADGERTCVIVESCGHTKLHPEAMDFIIASGVLAARALLSTEITPLEIAFAHDAPTDASHHRRVFNAPLRFHATQTACVLPTALLLTPLPTSSAHIRSSLAQEAERRIASCSAALPQRARTAILEELRQGDPSIKRVAARMRTYPRLLTRQLHEAGLTYRELLAQTRLELAEQYLRRPGMRIVNIAELLGYSDKSAFNRAFKRRTGYAPREYRRRFLPQGADAKPQGADDQAA